MSYETEYWMRDDHAECREEIKRLEAINAESELDSARLDWLEKQAGVLMFGGAISWVEEMKMKKATGETIRECIDKAMETK